MKLSRTGATAGLFVCVLLTGRTLSAQLAPDAGLTASAFEVASVKPNESGTPLSSIALSPGGRFTATNVTLRELIRVAYGIQNAQIVGGPTWIGSARFDVAARADGRAPPSLLMVRRLLAERFQLAAHTETRELSAYALTVARADRRLGPQLHASKVDCAAAAGTADSREPSPAPQPGERQMCDTFAGAAPRFVAGGVSMAQLAASLSRQVRAVVLDRTALAGLYDFDMQWTPELPPRPPGADNSPVRLNGFDVDPNGPSIFTALQEQLGLKLQSEKGPVDVVVIDSVSQPTPD